LKRKNTKRERAQESAAFYVRNADLLPAVIEAKQLNRVTDRLIVMIKMIAERYSRKSNFIGYSFREDMVACAVENLCKNALKFDHEKYKNPFAYYTTGIHNSFLQYMAAEKQHRNIRDALLIDAGANPSFNFLESERDESSFDVKESDEFIRHQSANPLKNELDAVTAASMVQDRVGAAGRAPGPVTYWSADDVEIDPQTGQIILKNQGSAVQKNAPIIEEIEVPKKKMPWGRTRSA